MYIILGKSNLTQNKVMLSLKITNKVYFYNAYKGVIINQN